jgi:hypothetical protein
MEDKNMTKEEINKIANNIAPKRCKEVLLYLYNNNGFIKQIDLYKQIYICGVKDGINTYIKTRENT